MKIMKSINRYLPRYKKPSDIQKFENVLVVSTTGLGDVILNTPAIKSLRASFPNINITLLLNKKLRPLFEGFEYVDSTLFYTNKFFRQLATILLLRRKKIDTIFLLHSNGPQDIFYSVLSGACNLLKMIPTSNHEYQSLFLNKAISSGQHTIENRLDLIRVFKPSVIDTTLEIAPQFYGDIGSVIDNPHGKRVIGIQVGAQDLYKMWPIERFEVVCRALLAQDDALIVLFGSTKQELKLTSGLVQSLGHDSNIINLCGQTSIGELPAAIKSLDVLLTNDTGTMHLAIALQKPTISLFGATDANQFGPYQDHHLHRVIQVENKYVHSGPKKQWTQAGMIPITVNMVLNALRQFYSRSIDAKSA